MTVASYETTLRVVDEAALRAFALKLNPDLEEDMTIEEAIDEALVNPRFAPLDSGYEIRNHSVFHDYDDVYRMRLEAMVDDGAKLLASAQECHRIAYSGDEFDVEEIENIGHVLYEHVLGSNASPPNLDIGFEIMNTTYEGPALPESKPSAP